MNHSESVASLASALAAAQKEFPEIPKTKEGKVEGQGKGGNNYSFSYKYADLGDVVPKVVPILEQHGLAFSQFPDVNERGDDGLTTMVMHESGEWISGFMRLYLAKTTSQGHGSAITYARRYALCAALGIVADEDDDGHVASQQQRTAKTQGNRSEPNPQRSGGAGAKKGQLQQDIDDQLKSIGGEDEQKIRTAMANANYPLPLPAGALRMVQTWINEARSGEPF